MLVVLLLAGCTHSGLGQTTAQTGETGGDGPDPCPWVGTWTLSETRCGSFPYDSWFDDHDSAELDITQDPGGGCLVDAIVASADCTRTEKWHFSVPVGTTVHVDHQGISKCKPDACSFSVAEDVCSEGDLAAGDVATTIDDATGSLIADALLEETAPTCTLGFQTTWAKN